MHSFDLKPKARKKIKSETIFQNYQTKIIEKNARKKTILKYKVLRDIIILILEEKSKFW